MGKISALPTLFTGFLLLTAPAASPAGVFVSITIAPPALPVYVQPACPVDGIYGLPDIGPTADSAPMGFAGGFYGFHGGYWDCTWASTADTYNRTVVNNTVVNNRATFNGPGGIGARLTPQEAIAERGQLRQFT